MPGCEMRDCFAWMKQTNSCIALGEVITDRPCPFYKTREQLAMDEQKAKERLEKLTAKEKPAEDVKNMEPAERVRVLFGVCV